MPGLFADASSLPRESAAASNEFPLTLKWVCASEAKICARAGAAVIPETSSANHTKRYLFLTIHLLLMRQIRERPGALTYRDSTASSSDVHVQSNKATRLLTSLTGYTSGAACRLPIRGVFLRNYGICPIDGATVLPILGGFGGVQLLDLGSNLRNRLRRWTYFFVRRIKCFLVNGKAGEEFSAIKIVFREG